MAISISRLKIWSVKTNRCNVTTDTIITIMAAKAMLTGVVEVATKMTATRIARRSMELPAVEAAEAEVGIGDHITIEVEAATTTITIMRTEIREEGVTIAMSATSMVTIVVDASAAADIITLIEEDIITIAGKEIHVVVVREIRMIGSL